MANSEARRKWGEWARMLDTVIRGGHVVDGAGSPRFRADVGIREDTIAAVGDLDGVQAGQIIDATGFVVAPGFIDIHGHSDAVAWALPGCDFKVRQGVTSEVIGSCGISLAPCSEQNLALLSQYVQAITAGADLKWDWRSFDEWLRVVEAHDSYTNLIPLVGHGTLRVAVMGFDNRPPSPTEMEAMQALLLEALDAGAFGMSTGLVYPPGSYAGFTEISSLCATVARYGGLYATHIRNESHDVTGATGEALGIADRTGVTLLISHFKAMGRSNWGKVRTNLRVIEEARDRGLRVWLDQYPYTAGSTLMNALVPPWAHEGGIPALLGRLRDPGQRTRIISAIETVHDGSWENFIYESGGWDGVLVCSLPDRPELEGQSLARIARHLGREPGDVLADLLIEQRGGGMVVTFVMDEDDVRTVLTHPAQLVGSDGLPSLGKPHPRAYGTFPRVLGKYCREERCLTLEDAVRKMTSAPAALLGLADRGVVDVGLKADLTVLDPETIRDRATYAEPRRYPVGIEHVVVNGRAAVCRGALMEGAAGRVIRRP